jgi:hypothetical protein
MINLMVGDTMALLLFMETPRYIISSDLSIQYLALFTKIQYLALFFLYDTSTFLDIYCQFMFGRLAEELTINKKSF